MDYEKKYNEALERAKQMCALPSDKATIEYIFPELRESEDERMVREFNDWLCEEIECRTNDLRDEKDRRTLNMLCYVLTKVKDWLEKQKDHFRDDTKMVEQKSAENGVDVIRTSALLAADRLASAEMTGRLKERSEILENPEEYGLYKPAEWSEEEDWKRKELIQYLEEKGDYRTVWMTWLKSLRPQSKEELAKMLQEEYNKGKKEGERIGHTRGYNKGYKDAEDTYNKAVSYHS